MDQLRQPIAFEIDWISKSFPNVAIDEISSF